MLETAVEIRAQGYCLQSFGEFSPQVSDDFVFFTEKKKKKREYSVTRL